MKTIIKVNKRLKTIEDNHVEDGVKFTPLTPSRIERLIHVLYMNADGFWTKKARTRIFVKKDRRKTRKNLDRNIGCKTKVVARKRREKKSLVYSEGREMETAKAEETKAEETSTANASTGRPKRNVRAPRQLYVPDPNVRMEDDSSVDSDLSEDDEGCSIHTSDEESVGSSYDSEDEYEYDDFVVRDDASLGEESGEDDSEEDSDYTDSEDESDYSEEDESEEPSPEDDDAEDEDMSCD